MKPPGIQAKFILGFVAIILLLGVAVVTFIKISLSGKFAAELEEKALSVSRNLAIRSIDYILTDDIIHLHQLVNEVKEAEKDVCYAFILDADGEVLTHTFEGGFPKDLREVNKIRPGGGKSQELLETEEGLTRDIAIPILKGSLGTVRLGVSENRIREAVRATVRAFMAITSAVLLVGVGITYLFVNRLITPIRQVTEAAQAIGDGNLDFRVGVNSKDEIGRLANTFNLMATRLKRAGEELESAQEQLIQTGKLASVGQFTSGVAHEINNPLGGILNCVRRLLSSPRIKGEERQYLELILKGLSRIENIIRQLFAFSDQRKFEPRPTDINKVIEESLAFVEHRCREQKTTVERELAKSLPSVNADPFQLQQVFMNVIKNALDAMPKGGRLSIRSVCYSGKEKDRFIIIEFTDTGLGINKEDLNHIFDPFFTRKEVGEGMGLGLSVSYGIIQRHGGVITAYSKEGEGTTITIRLPVTEE